MPARPMKERRREDQRDSGAPLGMGGGLPLLSLSLTLSFFFSYGSVMRRVEQKENGIWLFCNPEIHSSHSVSPWSVLERYGRKEMEEVVVGGGACVCTRAHKCVPLIC